MKKILALVLALIMVLAVANAFAAGTITINRDDSWDSSAENANATYTYYKIFNAKDIDQDVDVDTGEQTADSAGTAVYWVDSLEKAQALPDLFLVSNKAPSEVTAADAAADGNFYVTLASDSTSASDIAAALQTMVDANTTLFPGASVTSDDNPVVLPESGTLDDGYYLIVASNGSVLAVQTLDDVEINEKNDYPTVTKEQKKAADPDYTEAEIPAEIGKYIDYQITVHVPANANKDIIVVDKMSAGLEYDDSTGLTYDPDISANIAEVASDDEGYDADATWQIKIPAATVIENQGEDIVITYRALITEACLIDTDRENEVTLTYDDGNYVLKDETNYTTYFTGIEKVDGDDNDVKLEGVKFELTLDGEAYNVTKSGDYYIPGGDSNEVETDTNGLIIIRGLDNTLGDFVLTETETNEGYNLLETPKTLTLVEDTANTYATDTFDQIENNKGTILPSTGGIGTTIFYVLGGLLVVGAAVVLVARRKAESK